ncbi:PKD domain-containing protein [Rubrolithibacter danxiaensis]|uniref:PKD domain-containing protein n=1 Tax=Rubrolithibacter danxiaensis TaxID=3390805 RepID=UPI003BF882D9
MLKNLRKLLITILYIGIFSKAFGQVSSITIGKINPGNGKAYGIGSTIAVPITISDPNGDIHAENKLQLWLSDENGNFNSSKAQNIGEITDLKLFYTTFINGIIPIKFAGTGDRDLVAGDKYRVIVKANLFRNNGTEAYESPPSEYFTISTNKGVIADINSANEIKFSNMPKAFGKCTGENFTYKFTNNSTPGASVKASIKNEAKPDTQIPDWTFSSSYEQIQAELAHYTVLVTAELNGIIGTKGFFLLNNSITIPFKAVSNADVCIPVTREYTINYNDLSSNFPGTIYYIDWNDGPPLQITAAQLKKENGKIWHEYKKSSCNLVGILGTPNVYGIRILAISPFCGEANEKIITSALVLNSPKNEFSGPDLGCVGTPISFINLSEAQSPRTDIQGCKNLATYSWEINGRISPELKDLPASTNPKITFDSPGIYKIRLLLTSTTACDPPPPSTGTITIVEPPKADFSISMKNCVTDIVPTVNKALNTADNYIYTWSVSPGNGVSFENNTKPDSKEPIFKFTEGGIYVIRQQIQVPEGCSSIKETEIIVNEKPTIVAEWTKKDFCGTNVTLNFNSENDNPLQTIYTGTYDSSGNYSWEISGGSFEFVNNTNSHSMYPTIIFKENSIYTVKIKYNNNCGEAESIEKQITFTKGINVNAGLDQTGCKGAPFQLEGTVANGQFKKAEWAGGSGNLIVDTSNPLKATYKPSPDEVGPVRIRLTVFTNEEFPCDQVTDELTINIQAPIAKFSWRKDFQCRQLIILPEDIVVETAPDNDTYTWTFTSTNKVRQSKGINFPRTVVDPNDSMIIKLVVTSKTPNCPPSEFSHTFRTIVPDVTFKIKEKVCTDEGVQITFENTTPGKSEFKFNWDFGNGLESTLSDPPPITFPSPTNGADTTYNVKLRLTTAPCVTNPPTPIPDPIILNVKIPATYPNLKIIADNTQGCGSLSVNFKAEAEGASNLLWDFGDGTSCTCKVPPPHIYKVSTTPYTIRLTANYPSGCSKTVEMKDYIRVGEAPIVNFEIEPDSILYSPSNEFHFKNLSIGDQAHLKYIWNFGDHTSGSTEESPSHIYQVPGTYKVRLSVSSSTGCFKEIEKTLKFIGSIDTLNTTSLYVPNAFLPNSPVTDLRIFKAKGGGIAEWRMRIFNKWGETVWETTELDSQGSPIQGWDGTMNGKPVPQGVYFWEIKAKMKDGSTWPGISYKNSAPKHVGTINLIR